MFSVSLSIASSGTEALVVSAVLAGAPNNGLASAASIYRHQQIWIDHSKTYLYLTLQGATDVRTPVLNSKADLTTNLYNQSITSGAHSSPQSGTAVGTWNTGSSLLLKDSRYLVYPNFGLIVYNALNYGGAIILNFKNTTSAPVFVRTTADNTGRSIKVYFNDVELT